MLFQPAGPNTDTSNIPANTASGIHTLIASPQAITIAPGQTALVDLTLNFTPTIHLQAEVTIVNLPPDLTPPLPPFINTAVTALQISANDYAASGVYILCIEASFYSYAGGGSPVVLTGTATTYIQVTVTAPINLKNPKTLTATTRQPLGAIRQMGQSGPVFRRFTVPVQTGSKPQVGWRHIFSTAKSNYAVVKTQPAVPGINQSLSPADAWALVNSDYFGIVLPGPTVDGVTGQGIYTNCATPDAYYAMAQATRTSLMLPPLPTPVITTLYLSMPASPVELTLGPYTVSISGQTVPLLDFPDIYIDIGANSTTTDTPIDSITASGTGVSISASGFAAASWPAHNITYSAIAGFYQNLYAQCILPYDALTGSGHYTNVTTQGFEPSFMNQNPAGPGLFQPAGPGPYEGDAELTWNTDTSSGSGTATTLGTVTFSNPIYNTASQRLHVWQTDDSLPSTIPITITIVAGGIEYTTTINLTATSGNLSPANKPPYFNTWASCSSTTTYDDEMQVTGFFLNPTWYDESWYGGSTVGAYNTGFYPTQKNSGIAGGGFFYMDTPGMWQIIASPAYASSYSPPDPSTWVPILWTGPTFCTEAELLAAWEAVFGALPASGNIKFQLCYADPDTGAVSPSISCTAGWKNGTLKGANRADWTGPLFFIGTAAGVQATGATSTSTHITYEFASGPVYAEGDGAVMATGFTPAGYNQNGTLPSSYTTNTITIPSTANPGPCTTPGLNLFSSTGLSINAPGADEQYVYAYGQNGTTDGAPDPSKPYSGTVAFTPVSDQYFQTDTLKLKKMFPPGLTFTVDPPSVTIAANDNSIHAALVTATATADVWPYIGYFKISATDEISTTSAKEEIALFGGSALPPSNVLDNIGPGSQNIACTGATWAGMAVTFTVPSGPWADYVGGEIASSGFTPGGYNSDGQGITAATATSITVYLETNPGTATGIGTLILSGNPNPLPGDTTTTEFWTSNPTPTPFTATITVESSSDNVTLAVDNTQVVVPVQPPPVTTPAPTTMNGCSIGTYFGNYAITLPLDITGTWTGLYATISDATYEALNGGPWEITDGDGMNLKLAQPVNQNDIPATCTVTITNPNNVSPNPPPTYPLWTYVYGTFNLTIAAGTASTTHGVCIQVSMTVGSVTQTYVFYLN